MPKLIDFEGARNYAIERLLKELAPELCYHSIAHTRDDVVPAVERLAELEGVNGEARTLLITAAWYHDIGFVQRFEDNEEIAVEIAEQALPRFGYSLEQLRIIRGIIMATRLPQTPHNILEEIMADADLDVLGREEFFDRSKLLRAEMATLGRTLEDNAWNEFQLSFLSNHTYFTSAAKRLRAAGKQRNLEGLFRQIVESSQKRE